MRDMENSEVITEPTVTLTPVKDGVEISCSICSEVLAVVPNNAAAYNSAGKYLQHPCFKH